MSRRRARVPAVLVLVACAAGAAHAETATYDVRVVATSPPRIAVKAKIPCDGTALAMATSRPGDVPELADAGWPALVKGLRVTGEAGESVSATPAGAGGWTLSRAVHSTLTLDYEVDYASLAARSWPAPRECAYADPDHFVAIARSIFITTPAQRASEVRFSPPRGWRSVTAWGGVVPSTDDLTENLIAFTRSAPDTLAAGGFHLKVVPLGPWKAARAEVRRVLGAAVQRLVAFVGANDSAEYLVVLLPQREHGGESFRASFALTLDATPSAANLDDWGNTVAHEVFHHWNGWVLHGADFASTQWFQEGFTEYAANLALVSAGLTTPEQFNAKLAAHVTKYRKLTPPLDSPGTHKGPPLYSGGALVALTWDATIREATGNAHGLGDVFRALLRDREGGKRPYAWPDIEKALASVAPADWDTFHRRFVHGAEPLPLAETFARLGLVLTESGDASARVSADPTASEAARARYRALTRASR